MSPRFALLPGSTGTTSTASARPLHATSDMPKREDSGPLTSILVTLPAGHEVRVDGPRDLVDGVAFGIGGRIHPARESGSAAAQANTVAARVRLWIVPPAARPTADEVARLRALESNTYLVVVGSACPDAEISVLLAGADAYWTLPLTASVLLARVQAILRRELGFLQASPSEVVLHSRERLMQVGETFVQLSPREYCLVEYLHAQRGRWVSTEQVRLALFPGGNGYDSSLIRTHVHNIRRKLAAKARVIQTARGRGLMLCPPPRVH